MLVRYTIYIVATNSRNKSATFLEYLRSYQIRLYGSSARNTRLGQINRLNLEMAGTREHFKLRQNYCKEDKYYFTLQWECYTHQTIVK